MIDNRIKLISVDVKNSGLTDQICDRLSNENNYLLFIAPEGTRSCIDKLRSGYWNISKKLRMKFHHL